MRADLEGRSGLEGRAPSPTGDTGAGDQLRSTLRAPGRHWLQQRPLSEAAHSPWLPTIIIFFLKQSLLSITWSLRCWSSGGFSWAPGGQFGGSHDVASVFCSRSLSPLCRHSPHVFWTRVGAEMVSTPPAAAQPSPLPTVPGAPVLGCRKQGGTWVPEAHEGPWEPVLSANWLGGTHFKQATHFCGVKQRGPGLTVGTLHL